MSISNINPNKKFVPKTEKQIERTLRDQTVESLRDCLQSAFARRIKDFFLEEFLETGASSSELAPVDKLLIKEYNASHSNNFHLFSQSLIKKLKANKKTWKQIYVQHPEIQKVFGSYQNYTETK